MDRLDLHVCILISFFLDLAMFLWLIFIFFKLVWFVWPSVTSDAPGLLTQYMVCLHLSSHPSIGYFFLCKLREFLYFFMDFSILFGSCNTYLWSSIRMWSSLPSNIWWGNSLLDKFMWHGFGPTNNLAHLL